jgi:hypothetical protein
MNKLSNFLKFLLGENEKMCDCGKYPKCIRKIYTSEEGRVWVETEEHFKCGKTENQIKEMESIYGK